MQRRYVNYLYAVLGLICLALIPLYLGLKFWEPWNAEAKNSPRLVDFSVFDHITATRDGAKLTTIVENSQGVYINFSGYDERREYFDAVYSKINRQTERINLREITVIYRLYPKGQKLCRKLLRTYNLSGSDIEFDREKHPISYQITRKNNYGMIKLNFQNYTDHPTGVGDFIIRLVFRNKKENIVDLAWVRYVKIEREFTVSHEP